MNLEDLSLVRKGRRVGFVCSTFDLLHAGHVLMLQEAKSKCDILVVGLLTDPTHDRLEVKNPPVQTILERWVQLQALDSVDLLIPFDSEADLVDLIKIVVPDIRFVGEEYEGTNFTGKDLCKVEFTSRTHSFSSSSLRKRIKEEKILDVTEEEKIKYLEDLYEY